MNFNNIKKDLLEDPYNYSKKISIKELEDILRELSFYYYNTKESLVPDEIFDIIKNVLEERDPKNLFLKEVGSPISKNKVKLPYFMPSLNKIKPSTNLILSWLEEYKGPYVVSDKLDGVSALLVKTKKELKLYTRGDGTNGQDISHLIPFIFDKKILDKLMNNIAIRGELIISKNNFKKIDNEFKNGRNAISGLVNAKHFSVKLAKLTDFIAYSLLNPQYKQTEQMSKIHSWKLPIVTYKILNEINNDFLSKYLLERRKESEYEIDGLVVVDSSQIYNTTVDEPEYEFAFKTLLTDQIAETLVLDLEWTVSKHSYLKPKVKIQPVEISGVTIKNATAFNAKFVVDNKLGPGSIIKIVRSGDVIPHILEVIKSSSSGKPKMPLIPYVWNKTGIDILVKDVQGEAKDAIIIKKITNFFSTLGIKNISEGIVTKLVINGFNSIPKIIKADKKKLENIEGLGSKIVEKIFNNIDSSIKKVTLSQLMAASTLFGRGLGNRKLKVIVDQYPNIMNENFDKKVLSNNIMQLEGFDELTTTQFIENFPKFKKFYSELEKVLDLSHLQNPIKQKKITKGKFLGKKMAFTGFRDAELKKFIEDNGGKVSDTVSKNTDLLIYVDTSSSKYKKAIELNIETIKLSNFKEKNKIE
ncbi:NAD-dependent DNA ligase [uncultured virus]|nr:NAD-dependent DNA ligase [uncultured virus]